MACESLRTPIFLQLARPVEPLQYFYATPLPKPSNLVLELISETVDNVGLQAAEEVATERLGGPITTWNRTPGDPPFTTRIDPLPK